MLRVTIACVAGVQAVVKQQMKLTKQVWCVEKNWRGASVLDMSFSRHNHCVVDVIISTLPKWLVFVFRNITAECSALK